jgi:hypothetical protein
MSQRHCQGIPHKAARHAARVSEFVGVFWHAHSQKWQAQISYRGKTVFAGSFDDEVEAALAYNEKAIELFGADARLN